MQRHRWFAQTNRSRVVPWPISRGPVHTGPLTETENTPQSEPADAVSSAVTVCTTRAPNV